MKKKKTFIIIAVCFVLLLVGANAAYHTLVGEQTPGAGNDPVKTEAVAAPDFTATDQNGEAVRLSDFQGKPVVLNFWASWCGPCKSEMPGFDAMYAEYGDRVSFMMVNLTDGSRETVQSAASYIEEEGYSFPVFYDEDGMAAINYEVTSIPVTYFIDSGGNIAFYSMGAMNADSLQGAIRELTGMQP